MLSSNLTRLDLPGVEARNIGGGAEDVNACKAGIFATVTNYSLTI